MSTPGRRGPSVASPWRVYDSVDPEVAYSYLLAGLIPQARLKIYPEAAHGFLFQQHVEFARDVAAFLTE